MLIILHHYQISKTITYVTIHDRKAWKVSWRFSDASLKDAPKYVPSVQQTLHTFLAAGHAILYKKIPSGMKSRPTFSAWGPKILSLRGIRKEMAADAIMESHALIIRDPSSGRTGDMQPYYL